jgi:hypothetical protein
MIVPKCTDNWLRFSARLAEGALRVDSLSSVRVRLQREALRDFSAGLSTHFGAYGIVAARSVGFIADSSQLGYRI